MTNRKRKSEQEDEEGERAARKVYEEGKCEGKKAREGRGRESGGRLKEVGGKREEWA